MGALNGRTGVSGPRLLEPMELQFPMPPGEHDACCAALNLELAKLPVPLDGEMAQAAYTAFRAGWEASRMHGVAVRAHLVRQGMER